MVLWKRTPLDGSTSDNMTPETPPIRVLLVDDHPCVIEAVKSFLERSRRYLVVGEAHDGTQAVHQTRELQPDVVVMDITMPVMNGLEAARCLRETCPRSRVLILTVHDKPELVGEMMRCGARGCVRKNAPPSELVEAIERVHAGGLAFRDAMSLAEFETLNSDLVSFR